MKLVYARDEKFPQPVSCTLYKDDGSKSLVMAIDAEGRGMTEAEAKADLQKRINTYLTTSTTELTLALRFVTSHD